MQLKNLLGVLVAVTAVKATAELDLFDDLDEPELTLEERAGGCVKGIHVVAAGGEGSVKGELGYLQTLVDNIVNSIPHSNYHQCPYPSGADAPTSIGVGTAEMRAHVHDYARRCPRSKMALVGYSVGAAVMMNTLCGDVDTGDHELATHFKKNIVATIAYGDPTYVPGLTYDKGTCTGAQGPSDVPRTYPGNCFPFGKHLRSYCDYNDPECCAGNDPNVHFVYPSKYDGIATNWVKKHWQKAKHRHHHHN